MLLVLSLTSFALAVGVLLVWVSKKHINLSFKTLKVKEYRAKSKNNDESPHDTPICNKEQVICDSVSQGNTVSLANQQNDTRILITENDIKDVDEEICHSGLSKPQRTLTVILESEEEDGTGTSRDNYLKQFSI